MANAKTAAKAKGTRAVLYVRCSTDQQADSGLGLAAQRERLAAYCELRGLDVVQVVEDPGVSAGKPLARRPGGKAVLALIKAKSVDCVVALKLDRLFRSTSDCLDTVQSWEKHGIALHLVDHGGSAVDTSSAIGKLFITMLAGFSTFERDLGSERTKAALSGKAARGELGGEAPFGYIKRGDGFAVLPAEHRIVERARALRAEGLSLREVARALGAEGHRNRAGKHFEAQSVANMLKPSKRLSVLGVAA